jgi:apolipoprotein N-acyltransferase
MICALGIGLIFGLACCPVSFAQGLSPPSSIKVAAVDFVPAWGDLDGNARRLAQAAEEVARQGVAYAVFPETAVSGYLFSGPDQIAPFLDTIPGRTTAALLPILERTGLYMSVGIAERDLETGLAYNTAVLMGPHGIIGKYRKNGLNPQDQKVFAPGNTGVEVFDTPLGRIALLICYEHVLAVRAARGLARRTDHCLAFGVGSRNAGNTSGPGDRQPLHRVERAIHERSERPVGDRGHP